MVIVDVLFENSGRKRVTLSRVPCANEHVSIHGQSFEVQTVTHLSDTDRAEIKVNGILDIEKLPKSFLEAFGEDA